MIGTKPRQLRDSETLGLVLSARMESARARTAAAVFLMLGAEFVSVGLWPVIWFASVVLSLVADRAIAQACQRRRAETAKFSIKAATDREADLYNVRENRMKIYERDNYHCTYCGKQLTRFTATLDHITPVSEGGDNSAENLKTACLQCNSRKTSRPLGDFLAKSDPR